MPGGRILKFNRTPVAQLISCAAVFASAGLVFRYLSEGVDEIEILPLAGLIVLLLGAVLWLVSFVVDTPREIVARGSREFVQSVVKRDQAALKNLLSPNATLMVWNRDDIIAGSAIHVEHG